jgi:hypothetical protein
MRWLNAAHLTLAASNSNRVTSSQRLEEEFVNVAPTPFFTRLEGFDDRMARRVKMLGGVFVLRRVAAADVPASFAEAQVHPCVPDFQAILTALRARRDFSDLIEVCAFVHHLIPS